MSLENNYMHSKFGIDEVYIHEGFTNELLEKLYRRAMLTLDAEDPIVLKFASHDMILIFHNKIPNRNLIHRFLQFLNQSKDKEDYITSNTLLNEEELYSAVESKTFVLITHRILVEKI